jgi:hypothetical protein
MAYEPRENSGSLFRNEKKEKDNQPSHTGTALIDGRVYQISAWVKTGKNDSKFFSLAFKPKDDAPRQSTRERLANSPNAPAGYDDDGAF